MFYRPEEGHGLPRNPFNAIVTPRPIGWISTRGADGRDNLAPYSFFNAVAYVPPQVMFASTSAKDDRGDTKDSAANIRDTGVFAVNIVSFALRDAMNATSASLGRAVDEFAQAGLAKAECETVDCPFVAEAPAVLECRMVEQVRLPGQANVVTFGAVTGVHIRDEFLVDGLLDITRYQPLARLGYQDYCRVREVFALARPD